MVGGLSEKCWTLLIRSGVIVVSSDGDRRGIVISEKNRRICFNVVNRRNGSDRKDITNRGGWY